MQRKCYNCRNEVTDSSLYCDECTETGKHLNVKNTSSTLVICDKI